MNINDYWEEMDLETIINEYAVFVGFFLCFVFAVIASWFNGRKNETEEDKKKWKKETFGLFALFMILAVLSYMSETNPYIKALLHSYGLLR